MLDLDYLIRSDHLRFCPLEPTESFVKFCVDRGIDTSREQLGALQDLNLFYPIATVRQHRESIYETEAEWLMESGDIWDPAVLDETQKRGQLFLPWSNLRKGAIAPLLEDFYSGFQCYALYRVLKRTRITEIRAESWIFYNKDQSEELLRSFEARAAEIISFHQDKLGDRAARVCQIISTRYFPRTRSNKRYLSFPCEPSLNGWNWWDYIEQWDAAAVLAQLNLQVSDIKELWLLITEDVKVIDPLENWADLLSFVSVDKRDELKGSALLAETLRSMRDMLSMFYTELTEAVENEILDAENTSRQLQYLVTQYSLNPRPRVILVVEGHGEAEQFPRFAENILGASFSRLEIEVTNLEGIGAFTGSKKNDKYGALERFIDFNHHNETLVFIILDNEGRAAEIKRSLVQKQSRYFGKRTVTREEYIFLWESSVEFANFTNEEIATVLTKLSESNYTFQAFEIEACRRSRRGNPLRDLINTKTEGRYDLDKRELLRKLFDTMVACSQDEFREKISSRPVYTVLERIRRLAGFHPRAHDHDHWVDQQFNFGHSSVKEIELLTKGYLDRLWK
ncbi:MAG TPA: hypothetical protein VJ875_03035 [Pyrinomonadaceae bacterium]|nr:hypothetical protein [Pyrinomonadaceae bacterium]